MVRRPKILLLGAGGQLGHELRGPLACAGELTAWSSAELDLADAEALAAGVRATAPDVVVNAAAYTAVDRAEEEPARAHRINAAAVGELGSLAAELGAALVHVSTDFVFDGERDRPYTEADEPNPVNAYGQSKLEGERRLLEADAPAIVLRTAWVYSLRRPSFVSTILRLARERETLRVVSDQVGNPTFCRDLAAAIALLVAGDRDEVVARLCARRGVYHLAGSGAVSRYDLAAAAIALHPDRERFALQSLEPIDSDAYPQPARRPKRTALDTSRAQGELGLCLPPWQDALERALCGFPSGHL